MMNTKEKDSQYIMHTYGRYNVALKSGKGATAYDEDGKKYVDVASGIGVNSLGWCEDGWVKAVSEQLSLTVSSLLSNEITGLLKDSKTNIFKQGEVANFFIDLSLFLAIYPSY